MSWIDPTTGLTSGPIAEADYPLRCQHCEKDIRALNGFYEDRAGFTYCTKDLPHNPMPGGES